MKNDSAGSDRTSVMGNIYSTQMTSFCLCGMLAGRITQRYLGEQ